MKLAIVSKFLSALIFLITCSMFLPLFWALKDGSEDVRAFLVSIVIGIILAAMLWINGKGSKPQDMGTREAFAAVTLAWVFASLQGSLPYIIGGYLPRFSDAYFEAMSGFTTTGATVVTNIEALPRGILFWRAQTQWLGGMGIVVLTIALLPMLGVSMARLFKAESPGPVLEKITPRMQDMAATLWQVYIGLTALGALLLMAGGMTFYESVCHIFTAVSTGGFSTKNASLAAYNSAWFDWVMIFVMFMSGANFALHLAMLREKSLKPYKNSPEFRFYVTIVLAATLINTIYVYILGHYASVLEALRFAAFQTVSIISTTGYVTADYTAWPPITHIVLLTLMIVGGCAGSTAGAVKCIRIQLVLRKVAAEYTRLLHPSAAVAVRIGKRSVNSDAAAAAASFLSLYMILFIAAAAAVAATGEDMITSIGGVAATLGNVGPGFGAVGPVSNFANQHTTAKWVYTFCMLCGRLELYTVLILFTKDAYKR